jgi:isoquinoline 1-oxidoreductase beta subunit
VPARASPRRTSTVLFILEDPQGARNLLVKVLCLPAEQVTVNVTLLGGGFGRKSRPDFVVEAALLSRAMSGKPIKLTWTREDDLLNDYFHTVSVERLEAGLDKARKVMAWPASHCRAHYRIAVGCRPAT